MVLYAGFALHSNVNLDIEKIANQWSPKVPDSLALLDKFDTDWIGGSFYIEICWTLAFK